MPSQKFLLSDHDLKNAILRGLGAAIQRRRQAGNQVKVDRSIGELEWGQRYLSHYFRSRPSEMHRKMGERLRVARQARGSLINIIGPRGNAKSTIGSLEYVLRSAVEGTEPLIWIVSETGDQAAEFVSHLKTELEENELLARDYPEACGVGRVWRADRIRLRNNCVVQGFGVGQKLRGRRYREHRPTLIVCDDIQSDRVITSAEKRAADWSWFTGALLKAGNKRTNFVNLATALHRESIGGRLATQPGWEHYGFASIVNWPSDMGAWEAWADIFHDPGNAQAKVAALEYFEANRSAMTAGAEVLWPDEEDLYTLMSMRERDGRTTFEREKQGRPVNPEDNEWPEDYFHPDRLYFDEWPEKWQVRTMALDPSKGKDARRSDYSAIVKLACGVDGILYVDADLQRRPTPTMVADSVAHYRQFKPDGFGCEGNAWQELLAIPFDGEFERQAVIAPSLWMINNQVNKQVRIRRLGPLLSQRRIRFKSGSPGAALLIGQLRDFPDKNAHDDGPDALEMAVRLANEILGQPADGEAAGERVEVG